MNPPAGIVVRVKFKDRKQFESVWVKDLSHGGIFLRTKEPAPMFTRLTVVLELPGGGDMIDLAGEVVRVVSPEQAGPGTAAGMGVQFVDVDAQKRKALEAYAGAQGLPKMDTLKEATSRPTTPLTPEALLAGPPPPAAPAPGPPPPAPPRRAPSAPPVPVSGSGAPTITGSHPALAQPPPPAPSAPRGAAATLEARAGGLRRLLWLCADAAALARVDPYELLGVTEAATADDIADAIAVLRAVLDPDTPPADVTRPAPDRILALVRLLDNVEATLGDPARRAAYDARRRRPAPR